MAREKTISPQKAAWIQEKIDEIKTLSHMPLPPEGALAVSLDDITADQRAEIATLIKGKLLNTYWAGKAKFHAEAP